MSKDKHMVFAFGRMNPPTAGHSKLVDKVHSVARQNKADHRVIVSHSQDKYKNAVMRLESMKGALESMSKEDQEKHKRELKTYYQKIDELTKQANAALKKLNKVS